MGVVAAVHLAGLLVARPFHTVSPEEPHQKPLMATAHLSCRRYAHHPTSTGGTHSPINGGGCSLL